MDGRGIFCMDIMMDHLVARSADHGLRYYNLSSMKHKKELYSTRYGHSERVSQVNILQLLNSISRNEQQVKCYGTLKEQDVMILGNQESITKLQVVEIISMDIKFI